MWVHDTTLIMPHTTRHAEFSSASHCEPCLVLVRGQILKQVQDDIMRLDFTHKVILMLKQIQHDEMRTEHRDVWHLHADKASTASGNGVLVTNPVHQILSDPNSCG